MPEHPRHRPALLSVSYSATTRAPLEPHLCEAEGDNDRPAYSRDADGRSCSGQGDEVSPAFHSPSILTTPLYAKIVRKLGEGA